MFEHCARWSKGDIESASTIVEGNEPYTRQWHAGAFALVHETVYNRSSADTTTVENPYEENFAIFFERDPEHEGMLQMISPRDGSVQAIVEICRKENRSHADALSALRRVHDYRPVEGTVEFHHGRRVALLDLR